jgi:hypothetical protein|tara:strand:- start:1089 stop:1445 length:357 start_codon:yes stop_codon:yes gene_type:complete
MAQDFERAVASESSGDVAIGTAARTIITSNSDDAIIGIRLANILNATIKADVYITSSASGGSADSYIVKNVPIPAGGSIELIDGGAKIVLQSGDVLKAKADTANSLNVWVSFIDSIST